MFTSDYFNTALQHAGTIVFRVLIEAIHYLVNENASITKMKRLSNAAGAYCLIDVQQLTSLNLVLRTTIMTPVKPQISKFKAEKHFQKGFNVLRRLYS
jgi:hypothetical protein